MIEDIKKVVVQAGEIALDYFSRIDEIKISQKKNPKDLVTEADVAVESYLFNQLKEIAPEYGFWGEEKGKAGAQPNRWVVDPIDGTHSFIRGQYFWGISLALELSGDLALGVVYAPLLKDLFHAVKNKGAFKNDRRIKVSKISQLKEAMVATGFACLRDNQLDNNLKRFSRIAPKSMDQRRFGSAALDLCMVADGQLDAFWEQNLNLYDIAAGCLIVKEAGGMVSDFDGVQMIDPSRILVSNGQIHGEMLALMRD
ncbi:MAG: inositol monophosphatase [Deltaproteobacteria bacterium]|nr:inositol monophosphatase [Deltaproteobacteria bacterium]